MPHASIPARGARGCVKNATSPTRKIRDPLYTTFQKIFTIIRIYLKSEAPKALYSSHSFIVSALIRPKPKKTTAPPYPYILYPGVSKLSSRCGLPPNRHFQLINFSSLRSFVASRTLPSMGASSALLDAIRLISFASQPVVAASPLPLLFPGGKGISFIVLPPLGSGAKN